MNSSNKIGVFYLLMAIILTIPTGLGVGNWLATATAGTQETTQLFPSGFTILFGFGMVVLGWLADVEFKYRRSVKWYLHGPEPVLVK